MADKALFDYVKEFISTNLFSQEEGLKGGAAGPLVGAGIGFAITMNPAGAVAGAIAGTIFTPLAKELFQKMSAAIDEARNPPPPPVHPIKQAWTAVTEFFSGPGKQLEAPAAKPVVVIHAPQMNPAIQAGASENATMQIGGKQYAFSLPKPTALKRPWQAADADAYFRALEEDTSRMIDHPSNPQNSAVALVQEIKDRNQPFLDYVATVSRYDAEFRRYNDEIRPQWMQQLGMKEGTTLAAVGAPPEYTRRLELKITEPDAKTKAYLDKVAPGWDKLDPAAKLARMEQALSERMIKLSASRAAWHRKAEEQDSQFLSAPGLSEEQAKRVKAAVDEYLNGNEKDLVESVIVRHERDAEDAFRAKMEAIAAEIVVDEQAGQLRKMTSLIVEERRTGMQWNMIQQTKKMWASQAESWLQQTAGLSKEITDYAARYAGGARANEQFAIVSESAVPLILNDEANKKADAIIKKQQESRNAVLKGRDGIKALLAKLEGFNDKAKSGNIPEIDIEKEIRTLPTRYEIQRTSSKGDENDKDLRGALEEEAKKYNDAVKRYKENKADPHNKAALSLALEHLGDAMKDYASSSVMFYRAAKETMDKQIAELAAESKTGTTLQGVEGFRMVVADHRSGGQNIVLDGIKKDGKYMVTGWTRMGADGKPGQMHWLGKDVTDTTKAVTIDPTKMDSLSKIIEIIDKEPATSPTVPPPRVTSSFGTPATDTKETAVPAIRTEQAALSLQNLMAAMGGSSMGRFPVAPVTNDSYFANTPAFSAALAQVTA